MIQKQYQQLYTNNMATKKKAVKKASAKTKPLIEGKYSHKILLRLFPNQGKIMEQIMQLEDDKAYSKTIARCIDQYPIMKRRLEFLEKEVEILEAASVSKNLVLSNFNAALKNIQNFVEKSDSKLGKGLKGLLDD